MSQTLLIELAGDPNTHYVVDYPDRPIMTSMDGMHTMQVANTVIDADTRQVLKSRYMEEPRLASLHEMQWFMRGTVHHVSIEEMVKVVKNLHGDW